MKRITVGGVLVQFPDELEIEFDGNTITLLMTTVSRPAVVVDVPQLQSPVFRQQSSNYAAKGSNGTRPYQHDPDHKKLDSMLHLLGMRPYKTLCRQVVALLRQEKRPLFSRAITKELLPAEVKEHGIRANIMFRKALNTMANDGVIVNVSPPGAGQTLYSLPEKLPAMTNLPVHPLAADTYNDIMEGDEQDAELMRTAEHTD